MTFKVSRNLAERLKEANASDEVEIILELHPPSEPETAKESGHLSRSEMIAAKKEAFSRSVTPIEETIRKLGGEITGRAWINQTVRARVPAQSVEELSGREEVAALDTPNPLKREAY